jgi:hypothetical protein
MGSLLFRLNSSCGICIHDAHMSSQHFDELPNDDLTPKVASDSIGFTVSLCCVHVPVINVRQ